MRRALSLVVVVVMTGCALTGSYDFDGYEESPSASGGGGTAGAGQSGQAGTAGKGGQAEGGAGGQAGAGQSGQAGAGQGGSGQGGLSGGAGQSGQAGAGQGGQGGGGQAGAGAGNGGAGQSGQGGAGGAGQSGQSGQGGAGQAGQGGAGNGGLGGAGNGGLGGGGAGQAGSAGCPAPKTWYRDGDLDGHGTPLLSSVVACTKPADEPGSQWVESDDDCNDGNKDVFPGQQKYFGVPYAKPGAPGDVSFDYDCDGMETPTAPTYAPDCGGLALGSCAGTGYVAYSPARSGPGIDAYCGSTHTVSCVKQTILCATGAETAAGALACRLVNQARRSRVREAPRAADHRRGARRPCRTAVT